MESGHLMEGGRLIEVRQLGRSAAKIIIGDLYSAHVLCSRRFTKRVNPSSSASSDLAEVSAAQQTAGPVNIASMVTMVTMK